MVCGSPPRTCIAGYSLAGLFALYAMYRCDAFDRAAIISGSLWYPHFREFAAKHEMPRRPDRIYLSLGDKEKKTRHPLLKTVQDNTEAIAKHYRQLGIEVTLKGIPAIILTMSISEAPKELCPYDRENNIYEKRSFQIQSAGMRILGQSLCRLYARLQILLCVLYEAVHRPRRAVGDLFWM